MNQPVFASSKFTAYFRKSAIFAFDHLQKQYKFYGQDNTRQYKTIQDNTMYTHNNETTIQCFTHNLLGTNEKIANKLK